MNKVTLKVITLNCQRGYLLSDLRHYIQLKIQEGEEDFILLQEVDAKVNHIIQELLKKNYTYRLLRPITPLVNKSAEVAILYKLDFKLLSSNYYSYQPFLKKKNCETGAVIAKFEILEKRGLGEKEIVICSSHLHSGYHLNARKKEIKFIKSKFLELTANNSIQILGGDFNYLFPGEMKAANKLFSPEMVMVSNYIKYSSDSSLLEPSALLNKIFRILGKLGIKFFLKIDHIYINKNALESYSSESNVIKVKVSDHRPVMVELTAL